MFTQNRKLLSFNLSGNRIGDEGANSFATVNQNNYLFHFNNLLFSGITF